MRSLVMMTMVAGLCCGAAMARPSLQEVERIENGLFTISVADKIRRECDDISGRLFKAQREMRAMAAHAKDLGYSEKEIRAYVDDKAEKRRMRKRRDAYLSAQGVVKSRPETYCVAGRVEIRKSTDIGDLLRAW